MGNGRALFGRILGTPRAVIGQAGCSFRAQIGHYSCRWLLSVSVRQWLNVCARRGTLTSAGSSLRVRTHRKVKARLKSGCLLIKRVSKGTLFFATLLLRVCAVLVLCVCVVCICSRNMYYAYQISTKHVHVPQFRGFGFVHLSMSCEVMVAVRSWRTLLSGLWDSYHSFSVVCLWYGFLWQHSFKGPFLLCVCCAFAVFRV